MDASPAAEWGLGLLLRSAGVVLLAGIAAWLLRRASAAWRCLVWRGLTLGVAALPLILVGVPRWLPHVTVPTPRIPAPLATIVVFRKLEPGTASPPVGASHALPSGSWPRRAVPSLVSHSPTLPEPFPWQIGFLAVWGAGALWLSGQTVRSLLAARHLLIGGRVVEDPALLQLLAGARATLGLHEDVAVRLSDGARVPMVFGHPRATVILPAGVGEWPGARVRSVLLHELAHVRRADWAWLLVARWNCILYWPNPLVWWAAARLKAESEASSDDLVLTAGVRPSDYASHLLEVLRELPLRQPFSATTLAMAQGSQMHLRLAAILSPGIRRSQPRRGVVWVGSILVPVGVVLLGSVGVAPRDGRVGSAKRVATPGGGEVTASRDRSRSAGSVRTRDRGNMAGAPVSLPLIRRPAASPLGTLTPLAGSDAASSPLALSPTLPVTIESPVLAEVVRDRQPEGAVSHLAGGTGTILVGGYSQEAFRWQVYGLDVARGALEVLIPEGGLQVSATRDFRTVAYSREQDGDAPSLWLRPRGAAPRKLLAEVDEPVWSPDGKQFLLSRWVATAPGQGRYETYRYDADTGRRERLPLPEDVWVQDWDPRGQHLLAIVNPPQGQARLETLRPDGTERTVVIQGDRRYKQPRYSPDGGRIVYTALWNPAAGQPDDEVWIYDLAARRERRLFTEAGVVPEVGWSPDGRQLALVTVSSQRTEQGRRIDGHTYRIEAVDASSGNRRTLARFPWMARVGAPVWTE